MPRGGNRDHGERGISARAVVRLAVGCGKEASRRVALRGRFLTGAAPFDGNSCERLRPAPNDADIGCPDGRDHAGHRAAVSGPDERGGIRETPHERRDRKRPARRLDDRGRDHGNHRCPAGNLRGLTWTWSEICSISRWSIATDARWDAWTGSCWKSVRASPRVCRES